ncbi:ArsR family transcriptional regulator [Candidatus Thorarchaeota archaeon]|nr:MAG: ArsR family transcriptional regulator [Candidatus Thorarchaeota archaeon]
MKFNRRAYLVKIRNVRSGLITRSEILKHLNYDNWTSAAEIAEKIDVTYSTVLYHLKNMQAEGTVTPQKNGSGWKLSQTGQTALTDY